MMPNQVVINSASIRHAAEVVATKARLLPGAKIYGVPRGGMLAAYAIAAVIDGRVVDEPMQADFIVDDLMDSGATMIRYAGMFPNTPRGVLYYKKGACSPAAFNCCYTGLELPNAWVVLPWEKIDDHDSSAEDSVVRMLQAIGEDPNREGLKETPTRVVKAWGEWFKGYRQKPEDFIKTFEDGAENCDEMVLLTEIPVFSHCEHHLAPFIGVAHVAYIPNGRIVGLSKIPKIVDMFARRLQVQERLTNQIADCLQATLSPLGVAVVVKAKHFCMATRGVKMPNVDTTTSAMRGVFFSKPETRAEFMGLLPK